MARPDFVFTRLQYDSGDWDLVDPRMPSNLIDSLVAYTTLRVDPREAVIALDKLLPPEVGVLSGSGMTAGFCSMLMTRRRALASLQLTMSVITRR